VDSFVTSLTQHAGGWVYVIVFVAAAAEAGLFLGLVFPGETVLLLTGYLAWRGDASLSLAVAAAVLGAIAGDSLSYEIGRRYGPRLRSSRLGRRIQDRRWEKAERFFEQHGASTVFVARFFTGPKSIVPAMAGQNGMPYRRFLFFNATSAAVWGCLHVGLGYVAGPSWRVLEHDLTLGGAVLGGVAVVGVVGFVLVRRSRKRQ
jgi:membrane protein DedA with SNARE-associated domain